MSNQFSVKKESFLTFLAILIWMVMLLWDVVDSLAPKGLFKPSLMQPLYVVLYFCIAVALLFLKKKISKYALILISFFGVLLLINILAFFVYPYRSWYSAAADFSSILLTVFTIFVCALLGEIYLDNKKTIFFVSTVVLLSSVFIAYFSATLNLFPEYFWNGRFDPAHPLLISASVCLLMRRVGLLSSVFFILLLLMNFTSGGRTYIFLMFVACFLGFYLKRGMIRVVLEGFPYAFIGLLLGWYFFGDFFVAYYEASRIDDLIQSGGVDTSLYNRFLEVKDGFRSMINASPLVLLIGVGFGGTWLPVEAYPEMNLLDSGRVYYIHITPFAFFFRYGLLGCFIYGTLLFVLIKDFFNRIKICSNEFYFWIYIAVFLIFINSFMRTFAYDFTSIFLIILYLIVRRLPLGGCNS